MNNTTLIGITQSGLHDVSSAMVNGYHNKDARLLSGFFKVSGDRYRMDEKESHQSRGLENYEDGAYSISFSLDHNKEIREFRNYAPHSADFSAKEELQRRINLLREAKGHYITVLTTWDLLNDTSGLLKGFIKETDVVLVEPEDREDLVASYILAHETNIWVSPVQAPLVDFPMGKANVSAGLADRLKSEHKLYKEVSLLASATKVKPSQVTKYLNGEKAFGRPRYAQPKHRYFSNFDKVRKLAASLA